MGQAQKAPQRYGLIDARSQLLLYSVPFLQVMNIPRECAQNGSVGKDVWLTRYLDEMHHTLWTTLNENHETLVNRVENYKNSQTSDPADQFALDMSKLSWICSEKEYALGNILACTPRLDARKIYTSSIATPNNNICCPVENAGYAMGLVLLSDEPRPERLATIAFGPEIFDFCEAHQDRVAFKSRMGLEYTWGQCAEELAKLCFDDDLDSIGVARPCVIRDENQRPVGIGTKVINPSFMLIYCLVNYHLAELESRHMTMEELELHSSLEDSTVKSYSIIKAVMQPSLVRAISFVNRPS